MIPHSEFRIPHSKNVVEFDINTGDASVSANYRQKHRSSSALVWLALGALVAGLVGVIVVLNRPLSPNQQAVAPPPVRIVEAPNVQPAAPVVAKRAELVDNGPVEPTELELALRDLKQPVDEPPKPMSQPPAAAADAPPARPAPSPSAPPPGTAELRELYDTGQLFRDRGYAPLRRIFAERFAERHASDIEIALDDDTRRWLDEHTEVKEELFTAIDPAHDDVAAALEMFAKLRRDDPDSLAAHWNLAVAVAVVWDDNRQAIYDYAHHQRRVKAVMPDGQLDAVANYQYLLDTDSGKYLPWEFLVYTVDHRTPLEERQWAVGNFLGKARMFGKCYSDVPYDHQLIATDEQIATMQGAAYTLENLLKLGGVCAHQADFSSRVGKSLGIPAIYAGGEAANQDQHAWVMWVELEAVGPSSIAFHLESAGRYRTDKYYVGNTRDPQTGEKITDRQLELRLHTVGMDARAARQADLAMAAYPELAESESLDVLGRLKYIAAVTELCPGNTEAWRELAGLAGTENLTRGQLRVLEKGIAQLFRTFSSMPDFTWEVFDDLTRCQADPKKRIDLYERLVTMYATADRPDLATQARLRQTDLYEAEDAPLVAARQLAATILAFADDGRYAPRMFDRMQQLCEPLEGGAEFIDQFYPRYLQKIPTHRGRTPSPYAKQMYGQAIEWYTKRGRADLVGQLNERLAWLEKGGGG